MSIHKYLILGALGLGALAIDSGTAEASTYTNRTAPWCMPRLPVDRPILGSDSAALIWKASGDLVLEPMNHFTAQIWSSGTTGRGTKLCFEASGSYAIYEGTAKIWSSPSGAAPPPPAPMTGFNFEYVLEPSLSSCNLSSRFKVFAVSNNTFPWYPARTLVGQGTQWTKAGICPAASESAISPGWCITSAASGPQRLVETRWATLQYRPYSGYLEIVGRGTAEGQQIWRSQTNGTGQSYKLCFEDTGRLAIFDAAGGVRWSTPAGPTTTGYMLGMNGCNLDITRLDGGSVHSIPSPRCPQTLMWNNKQVNAGTSDVVLVENDDARLAFQPDGNLVLRSAGGDEIWHSALAAGLGKRLAFQTDGNLVIYNAANSPVWSAKVAGQGVSNLTLDRCSISLNTSVDFQVISKWSRGSKTCATNDLTNSPEWSLTPSGNLTLLRTEESRLVWLHDGNLVLLTVSGVPVWSTNTGGPGRKLVFQADGNLVIYAGMTPVWASNSTLGWGTRTLKLGDHCTLTVSNSSWHSTLNDVCRVLNYSYERTEGDDTFGVVMHTHMTADSGSVARVDSSTGIDLAIFGYRANVFTATGEQVQDGSSTASDATVTILGDSTLALNISHKQEFWNQEKTFMAGPVPIVISAGASGSFGLSFGISSDGTMAITPSAGLHATVSAGIGAGDGFASASAGIRGQLTLIELSLPISMKINFGVPGQRSYTLRGDLELSSLSGSLSFYAEASIEVWGIEIGAEWTREIFSWDGIDYNKKLFEKTGQF